MKVLGKTIVIHRGETFRLVRKVFKDDGVTPYVLPKSIVNPYLIITVSSNTLKVDGKYKLNSWLNLVTYPSFRRTTPEVIDQLNISDNTLPEGASEDGEDCIYYNSNLTNLDKEDRYIGDIIIDEKHCPKIIKMFNDSKIINGTCVFYFRFTRMYGIGAMEEMLKMNGYKRLKQNEDPFMKEGKRYVVFSGDIGMNTRNKWKDLFNDPRNKYGKYIKYLLLSPSGSVGITLKNVRFLGIGSVEFNYSAIRQILGRVNRLNSHEDLPPNDRTLTNNIYIMTKNMKRFKENKEFIMKLCERKAPGSDEVAPTIEKIILYDSWKDDVINEDFKNRVLVKASITERVYKKF